MEMYNPSAKEWREGIFKQTREQLPVFIDRFIGLSVSQ
jgi:hypothetical protein